MSTHTKTVERKQGSGYFRHYSPVTKMVERCTGDCLYGQNSTISVDGRDFVVLHAESEQELMDKIEHYEAAEAKKLGGNAGVFGTQKRKKTKAPVEEKKPSEENLTREESIEKYNIPDFVVKRVHPETSGNELRDYELYRQETIQKYRDGIQAERNAENEEQRVERLKTDVGRMADEYVFKSLGTTGYNENKYGISEEQKQAQVREIMEANWDSYEDLREYDVDSVSGQVFFDADTWKDSIAKDITAEMDLRYTKRDPADTYELSQSVKKQLYKDTITENESRSTYKGAVVAHTLNDAVKARKLQEGLNPIEAAKSIESKLESICPEAYAEMKKRREELEHNYDGVYDGYAVKGKVKVDGHRSEIAFRNGSSVTIAGESTKEVMAAIRQEAPYLSEYRVHTETAGALRHQADGAQDKADESDRSEVSKKRYQNEADKLRSLADQVEARTELMPSHEGQVFRDAKKSINTTNAERDKLASTFPGDSPLHNGNAIDAEFLRDVEVGPLTDEQIHAQGQFLNRINEADAVSASSDYARNPAYRHSLIDQYSYELLQKKRAGQTSVELDNGKTASINDAYLGLESCRPHQDLNSNSKHDRRDMEKYSEHVLTKHGISSSFIGEDGKAYRYDADAYGALREDELPHEWALKMSRTEVS